MTTTATERRTAVPVSTRERGYADSGAGQQWWDRALKEVTPELRWPECIEVYDNMRHQDAQVASVLRAITAPILQTTWRVDGTGCDPIVTMWLATQLGLPIVGSDEAVVVPGRKRFNWTEHLRLALLCLPFGHMFFEQVYVFDEDAVLTLDDGTVVEGLYRLRKLGPRMHRTIARIVTARDGGLVAIEQYSPGTPGGGIYFGGSLDTVRLPVNRLVAYVHDREGSDWLGTSILRPAYKDWLLKDILLRVGTQAIQRNGIGIPMHDSASDDPKYLAQAEDLVSGIHAGDDSGIVNPVGGKTSLLSLQGSVPDSLPRVRYHDEQIARAVLAHFLNLGGGDGGHSYALGATLQDWFSLGVQSTGGLVRDTANAHVIEDLVDLTFGPDVVVPKLVFDEIGSKADAVIQAIAYLVSAGVLHPDESLEHFVRTTLGVPAYNGPLGVPTPQEEGAA